MNKEESFLEDFKRALISTIKSISQKKDCEIKFGPNDKIQDNHINLPEIKKLQNKEDITKKVKGKSMKNALITITIADISMSLDNVIAVTAIARDQTYLLMFGIGFSILLIAIFASAIVRLLTKFKWLSYVGLLFLIYLSTEMAIDGYLQIKPYISF